VLFQSLTGVYCQTVYTVKQYILFDCLLYDFRCILSCVEAKKKFSNYILSNSIYCQTTYTVKQHILSNSVYCQTVYTVKQYILSNSIYSKTVYTVKHNTSHINKNTLHWRHVSAHIVAIFRPYANLERTRITALGCRRHLLSTSVIKILVKSCS
jgi:hypothetical protein